MHKALSLLVAISSFGCATAIPYSYKERCAIRGMAFTGISEGSSYGQVVVQGQNGPIPISSSEYTEMINCELPKTQNQSCDIDRSQKILVPKLNYNDNIGTKKLITGIGYVLYIVPGVIAKIIYDGKKSTAVKESDQIATTIKECSTDNETAKN